MRGYLGIGNKDNKESPVVETEHSTQSGKIKWSIPAAFGLALIAQYQLEPPVVRKVPAIILYALSAILIWSKWRKQSKYAWKKDRLTDSDQDINVRRPVFLFASIPMLIIAFITFSDNSFNLINIVSWIGGSLAFVFSFWQNRSNKCEKKKINLKFGLLLAFVFCISLFFRLYRLEEVPGEMFSDHAEKLLDVIDILNGQTPIFFPRNTGREAIQFYLTASIIRLFNTGIGFTSLKIGTILAGLLTLPFIYLLAKEIFNEWVAILAVFFTGIGYWPNVISRVGLRFPFYPLFVAPVMYFLIKGLKKRSYNNLIVSGIFLGIGLHGYSPIRILPFMVGIIFILFFISEKKASSKRFAIKGFLLLAINSFILFLPLFRYMLDNPGIVNYRSLSRLTGIENPLDGTILLLFLNNLWNAITMFFHRNGVVWVNSVPNRPALDIVSAASFFIGLTYLIRLWWEEKNWIISSLVLSIMVLMLPSILSLAYPMENPALNRSSGAIIPVFIVTAFGSYLISQPVFDPSKRIILRIVGGFIIIVFISISIYQNYDLVFSQYHHQFLLNAWNTSEIGAVIKQYVLEGNDKDSAYVVPYPHWVDTRLVGINAGFPRRDYALWREGFDRTTGYAGEKLFILKPEDTESLRALELLYPQAETKIFYSKVPGRKFIIISVPGKSRVDG